MSSLLEVSGVSVTFDGFRAINNLSFQIGSAELRAIIGPNGAGKTTFMDIVTGKTRPDEGRILWGEKSQSLLGMNEAKIAQAGIGRKFQKPTVFEDQTVFENLQMALKNDRGPFAVLFYKTNSRDVTRIEALADEIGLSDQLHRKSGELSHGQKQWLEIGMLLAQEPRLLLVDEPAAGMNIGEADQLCDLIRMIQSDLGCGVIVIEHNMRLVSRLCGRLHLIAGGKTVTEGTPEQVMASAEFRASYLGTEHAA